MIPLWNNTNPLVNQVQLGRSGLIDYGFNYLLTNSGYKSLAVPITLPAGELVQIAVYADGHGGTNVANAAIWGNNSATVLASSTSQTLANGGGSAGTQSWWYFTMSYALTAGTYFVGIEFSTGSGVEWSVASNTAGGFYVQNSASPNAWVSCSSTALFCGTPGIYAVVTQPSTQLGGMHRRMGKAFRP